MSKLKNLIYFLGHGCHNNFVIIDNINGLYKIDEIINDAHNLLLKTGCDDLLIINTLSYKKSIVVIEMLVLEPNYTFADFCGNGSRLVGKFIYQQYPSFLPYFFISSRLGLHKVTRLKNNDICVELPRTSFVTNASKFIAKPQVFKDNIFSYAINGHVFLMHYAESIEPHLVIFEKLSSSTLELIGNHINFELDKIFPFGVHVNSCYEIAPGHIFVETFERSLFRITRSCGTGAISCAEVYNKLLNSNNDINVHTNGGCIYVRVNKDLRKLRMSGLAEITGGPYAYSLMDNKYA